MDKQTYSILNDPKYLQEKKRVFDALKDAYECKNTKNTVNLNGYVFFPQDVDAYTEPEKWVESALDFMAKNAALIEDKEILRPLAIEMGFYGVHFVDKIFGAKVFNLDGQWNNEYLTNEIGSLQMPDLEKNETFLLAKRVAEHFVKQNVKLPVFGMPTIASALNIAVNLYGEEVFCAFYDNEDGVKHDLKIINDVLIELHKYYQRTIPLEQLQPVVSWERTQMYGCGQLCGCSTQMISDETYKDFIMELDDALLGIYPNKGMIHLCGAHSQHIENFSKMKNLKALQLHNRAAEDLSLYLNGLRDDQIIYVNCCEEMPYNQALKISGGNRIVFVGEHKSVEREKSNEKNS